jgi:hypothetical protein
MADVKARPSPASARPTRRGVLGGGFVVLALAAEWLGHATTWFVVGGCSPGRALSGPLHAYLGPVGLLLVGLALVASWATWRGLRRLGAVAAWARRAVRPGQPAPPGAASDLASPGREPLPGPMRLWLALASVQVVVFLAQENLEARLVGLRSPGLHVLTAHLGAPVVIELVLALAATALATEVLDRWARHERHAAVAVARCRALFSRRAAAGPRGSVVAPEPPAIRFGRSFLPRPPPLSLV